MSAARTSLRERPPFPWYLRWPGLLLFGALALSWKGSEGSVSALFSHSALSSMRDFAAGFCPPAHSKEFLGFILRPLGETVAIAILGITLSIVLALPLSIAAISPDLLVATGDSPSALRRGLYVLARMILNLMRAIPELIWALFFVRAVGIGPAPGVLAIGVAYAGILGKVFAEIFEGVPRGPVRALIASGASPLRAFAFGVCPSAAPMLTSYSLYRFDCALRASAVLGLVGAGGIGQQLDLSLKMFSYDEVGTLVIALFALVAVVDQLSIVIRKQLNEKRAFLPQGKGGLLRRLLVLAGWGAAIVASYQFLDLSLGDLVSSDSLGQMKEFVGAMFPPDATVKVVRGLLPAVGETLAISVLGTAIAAVAGFLLAVPAALRLHADHTGDARRRNSRVRIAIAAGCRAIMNLGRTLPELVWALFFTFAIGLGPFAGALALAVHTGGVLGRLYTEALEEVPLAPRRTLRLSGASSTAATFFAILPQAFPQLVAYTLYRWEVNIRASAVLGLVGAGGLGKDLYVAFSLFDYPRTLTLVLLILVLVTVVDFFSGWLRRQVMLPQGSSRSATAGAGWAEVVVDGARSVVLELRLGRAQVFARPGEFPERPELPILLDLGDGRPIRCRAMVAARRDEEAGATLELRLRGMGPRGLWRSYRFGARRGEVRASAVEAF